MSSKNPYEDLESAVRGLKNAGVDTTDLETRLQDPMVNGVVIGPWPPKSKDKQTIEAMIKTRALFVEALDLMHANALPVSALSDQLGKASGYLNKANVGIGAGILPSAVTRSVVGKWPLGD